MHLNHITRTKFSVQLCQEEVAEPLELAYTTGLAVASLERNFLGKLAGFQIESVTLDRASSNSVNDSLRRRSSKESA